MVSYKKIVVGVLTLMVAVTAIIIYTSQVKLKVEIDKTTFYVYINNSWLIGGKEYNKLYNGTKLVNRTMSSVSQNITGNHVVIRRVASYQTGASIIDTYEFDGSQTDVSKIPIAHTIEIFNGKGLIYQYDATGLTYSGPTISNVHSPQMFGRGVKIEWDEKNYFATLYSSGNLRLKYKILNDYEIYSIRMFDPTIILYLNGQSVNRMYEYGSTMNITGTADTGAVCLDFDIYGYGMNYTCSKGSAWSEYDDTEDYYYCDSNVTYCSYCCDESTGWPWVYGSVQNQENYIYEEYNVTPCDLYNANWTSYVYAGAGINAKVWCWNYSSSAWWTIINYTQQSEDYNQSTTNIPFNCLRNPSGKPTLKIKTAVNSTGGTKLYYREGTLAYNHTGTCIWNWIDAFANQIKFNDTTTAKNVSSNSSVIVGFHNKSITLTSAKINITGYELLWWTKPNDTENSYACSGSFQASYPCANAVDENWNTKAEGVYPGQSYVYENYTLPFSANQIKQVNIYQKILVTWANYLRTNILNHTSGNWDNIYTSGGGGPYSEVNVTFNAKDYVVDSKPLAIRTQLDCAGASSNCDYFEGNVTWQVLNTSVFPSNIKIDIGNDGIIDNSFLGSLNGTIFTQNTLKDGSTIKNETYYLGGTKTDYFTLMSGVIITSAKLSLKGYEIIQNGLAYTNHLEGTSGLDTSATNAMQKSYSKCPVWDYYSYDWNDDGWNSSYRMKRNEVVNDTFGDGVMPNWWNGPTGPWMPCNYAYGKGWTCSAYNGGTVTEHDGYLDINSTGPTEDGGGSGSVAYCHLRPDDWLAIDGWLGTDYQITSMKFKFNFVDTPYSIYVEDFVEFFDKEGSQSLTISIDSANYMYVRDLRYGRWLNSGGSWQGSMTVCGSFSKSTWYTMNLVWQSDGKVSVNTGGICPTTTTEYSQTNWWLDLGDSTPYTNWYRVYIDDMVINNEHYDNVTEPAILQSSTISSDYVYWAILDWKTTTPTGTHVDYFMSADGGTHWENVTNFKNTRYNFTNYGNNLKWKALMYQDDSTAGTPFIDWINVTKVGGVTGVWPSNPYLDITADGDTEWNYNGNFTGSATTGEFASELSTYLTSSSCTGTTCDVPFFIYSLTPGIIELSNISIQYNPNPISFNTTRFKELINVSVNVSVGINSSSWGIVQIDGLNFPYYGSQNVTVRAHTPNYDTNDTQYAYTVFSNFSLAYPKSWIDYLLFTPMTNESKNVTPFGQTSSVPGYNITSRAYDKNFTFYIGMTPKVSCVNMTISNSSTGSNPITLNETERAILSRCRPFTNCGGIWFRANYGCNMSYAYYDFNFTIYTMCEGCI